MMPGRPTAGGMLQPSGSAGVRIGGGVVHPSSRDTLRLKRMADAAKQAKSQIGKVYVMGVVLINSGCGLN